eukprot:CAMPEP_0197907086 /NCGR_PEP_ID=MMETSP1439-20131203/64047_1 /TAXON_ID=66791 /ORGANISM="Gonyaulax spinifera, Strain CCMP409" /LENGTH=350 /DNA_ID=CAMNT_0043528491 /DNA_START=82 /DNA_END=1131 /DNA_ORIENTATION=+
MRVIIVQALLLVLLSLAGSEEEIEAALAADSECGSGDEALCALNALQLRGRALAAEDAASDQEHATAVNASGAGGGPLAEVREARLLLALLGPLQLPVQPALPSLQELLSGLRRGLHPSGPGKAAGTAGGNDAATGVRRQLGAVLSRPVLAKLNLGGSCCPAPNGNYLGCCPESMIPHPAAPPPAIVNGRKTLTVYHQTSPEACRGIMATGFRLGHGGWCGNAIYFALTPQATKTKAITPHSGIGCMLEAVVDVGNKLRYPCCRYCGGRQDEHVYWTEAQLTSKGYDSIEIDPGDGPEIIVYNKARILRLKEIPFDPAWTPHRLTYKEWGQTSAADDVQRLHRVRQADGT